MSAAFFMKLDSGAWGVRVEGAIEVGQAVLVTKRDATTKTVTITGIVGSSNGQTFCEITDADGSVPDHAPAAPKPARPAFAPTSEQTHILELFLTGQSLAIQAGAGTGKTSTLVHIAENTEKVGQYIAFNRAIVDDSAQKFPRNVTCSTAHQLARQAVGHLYSRRLNNSRRLKSHELAGILRIDPLNVTTYTDETKTLSPSFLAGLVMRGIEKFCQSADREPSFRHIPHVDNLDAPSVPERPTSKAVNEFVGRQLEPAMQRAWKDIRRVDGALPFRHSHYLKMWQLSGPHIASDFILFDEAQDASPVMVDIIRQQAHAQIVWVGDSQQEIYGWAGAINALASVPSDQTAFLTQSFRFGEAIADTANICLSALRAQLRLSGTPSIASEVGPVAEPHAILCRTNATAVREVLRYMRDGKRPHLIGGGGEIAAFARAARDLMNGRSTDHPELSCFDSWGEVTEYVEFDQQGSDLKLMVKLVDEFGVQVILEALDSQASEADSDVVISTAHKSKGREWRTVQLAGDFKDDPQGEELRLLYVACTRAQITLDITLVKYLGEQAA